MNNLYRFLYKNVKIKMIDGKLHIGYVDMYCGADENDNGIESIGILPNKKAKSGIEISANEIEMIEIV